MFIKEVNAWAPTSQSRTLSKHYPYLKGSLIWKAVGNPLNEPSFMPYLLTFITKHARSFNYFIKGPFKNGGSAAVVTAHGKDDNK